jgi:hypothetical protein
MSFAETELNCLADAIKLPQTYNASSMVVESLSGTQRAFLDDIGLTYAALHVEFSWRPRNKCPPINKHVSDV